MGFQLSQFPQLPTLEKTFQVEAEATNRACMVAREADCPLYVVHVMSSGAASCITKHRKRGAVIFGEAIAAALGVGKNLK